MMDSTKQIARKLFGADAAWRRFFKSKSGSALIEFAFIAPPFIALLLAILETALVFLAQQFLQSATTQTARLIMTGQAQAQNMTATQFQQAVCANGIALFTCGSIYVNSQKFSTFSSMSMLNPLSSGVFTPASLKFTTGNPGDIMLVQVFYQWPVYLAPLGFDLSNMKGNMRLLVGTAVFRNEPY